MAKVLINEDYLTNIAGAIRDKSGEDTKYKPSEMADAISSLTIGIGGGGGDTDIDAVLEEIVNGTY